MIHIKDFFIYELACIGGAMSVAMSSVLQEEGLKPLGDDWEAKERKWFFDKCPFPFGCGAKNDLRLEVQGVSARYRWWKGRYRPQWRRRVFEVARVLPGSEAIAFGRSYNATKFSVDRYYNSYGTGYSRDVERRYGYQSWKDASRALQDRVDRLPRERSNQLLSHFLDGIYAVKEAHRDSAWELAATIAEATFEEMNSPLHVLCLSFGGSER